MLRRTMAMYSLSKTLTLIYISLETETALVIIDKMVNYHRRHWRHWCLHRKISAFKSIHCVLRARLLEGCRQTNATLNGTLRMKLNVIFHGKVTFSEALSLPARCHSLRWEYKNSCLSWAHLNKSSLKHDSQSTEQLLTACNTLCLLSHNN